MDTSFALALVGRRDAHHATAVRRLDELAQIRGTIVTTHAVLFEFGNALSRVNIRPLAVQFLNELRSDPAATILAVDDDLFVDGLSLYSSRPDKEWGLVDCVSFVVMQRRNLTLALTADRHFQQAGFTALLLD